MSEPVEFDCPDCGDHVFAFGIGKPPDPPLCATCQVIREQPPGPGREAIRAALYDPEAMQYWMAIGSYVDRDCPERRCDNPGCQRLYRGPAMYCSLACADADR
jgi:hypothetical protein